MILVLTGTVHSGKTTFLKDLLPRLKALRLPVYGYLSPLVVTAGKRAGYDLFDIKKRQSIPFLRTEGEAGWQKVGPYFFLPGGLEAATAIILGHRPGGILVVDEVGPMELSGRGVWPALEKALAGPSFHCLLVVRKPLVGVLQRKLGRRRVEIFDIATKDILPAFLRRLSRIAVSPKIGKPGRGGRASS